MRTVLTMLVLALAPLLPAQGCPGSLKWQNLDLSCVNGVVDVTVIGGEIVVIVTHVNRFLSYSKWDVWGKFDDPAPYVATWPYVAIDTMEVIAMASWDSRPCAIGARSMLVSGSDANYGGCGYYSTHAWLTVTSSWNFAIWQPGFGPGINSGNCHPPSEELAFSYCEQNQIGCSSSCSTLPGNKPEMAAAAFILHLR